MFNSLNKVTLIGKASSKFPPELKVTPSGTCIFSLSLSTVETDKDKKKTYENHKIKFFGKTAELAERLIKADTLVYVEGKLHTNEFTNKDGQKVKAVEIIGREFVILDSMPYSEKGTTTTSAPATSFDDDLGIPF